MKTNYTFYTRFNPMLAEKGAAATAEYCVKMGFSSVEVLESTGAGHPTAIPDTKAAKDVRRILGDAGLNVACYSVGTNVVRVDRAQNAVTPDTFAVSSLKKQAEIAAALGCPYLHHTLFTALSMPDNPPETKPMLDACAAAAADIAAYAKPLGVTCIYEDQGMYVNGIENFGYFYREVKRVSDNVGVCGDVGNILFVDEDPVSFFAAFADEIRHVHIKDYLHKKTPVSTGNPSVSPGMYWLPTKGGAWLRDTMTGSGCIDFAGCTEILKKASYRGAYALELCHPEPHDPGVEQSMALLDRLLA
ncbi:MAG: TIM barrel protein [Clostridia bacterium]|nr:TIM barrel protein [Clostridia bacterium]